MPRLLLLLPTTTYRAESFLKAAKQLNVQVTVGTEQQYRGLQTPWYDLLALNFGAPEECVQTAVRYATDHPIHAVLGVDDNTAVMAALISAALGLAHNSVESVSAARNKYRMRQVLQNHGVPVPSFIVVPIHDDPAAIEHSVHYPCVVKPVGLSASCGVIRANTPAELTAAFYRVCALLQKLGPISDDEHGGVILVEDYVAGVEVALEGLLTEGTLRVLAMFDKPDPLEGPYFEETLYVTPSRLPASVQTAIADCAADAAAALGLRQGPIHGELRVNDAGVWLIELAARSIGGRCSTTLRFPGDLSLEEVILRHAMGLALPELDQEQQPAGVMMLPITKPGVFQEVRGQIEALAVPGVEELVITAEPGDELVPLPEGTRYLGFLFARADSAEEVEVTLREAHRRLDVVVNRRPATGAITFD